MFEFALEIILLISLSSCFGVFCGYVFFKTFNRNTARDRTIVAAAKSQPFKDKNA